MCGQILSWCNGWRSFEAREAEPVYPSCRCPLWVFLLFCRISVVCHSPSHLFQVFACKQTVCSESNEFIDRHRFPLRASLSIVILGCPICTCVLPPPVILLQWHLGGCPKASPIISVGLFFFVNTMVGLVFATGQSCLCYCRYESVCVRGKKRLSDVKWEGDSKSHLNICLCIVR